MRTVYGIPMVATSARRKRAERMGAKLAAYRKPSRSSSMARVAGRGERLRLTVIASSEAITAMYEIASSRKHQPSPKAAISTPPIDGPRMRLPLTIVELRAMALDRCARSSTISTTNDCRAGVSKALMIPWISCRTRM